MKTILLAFLALPLFAQQPIPFGATFVQGSTTIRCAAIDLSQFGGLFALSPPSITCMMQSSDPATNSFLVVIKTQDAQGNQHTYADKTAANKPGMGSPLAFATDDKILLSVVVVSENGQQVMGSESFNTSTERIQQ